MTDKITEEINELRADAADAELDAGRWRWLAEEYERDRDAARERLAEVLLDVQRYNAGLAKISAALHGAGVPIGADVATVASETIVSLAAEVERLRVRAGESGHGH